ncbi:hypothetical protein [Candidatus Nitrosarchaeum limnium]|jgi:hypothetical protein|uniref:Uncharacterized protein n=1 Tax=Candidatus Nitrosarchaeum limnium BG20 TaxID=859192 RepID=S2EUV0_9ARCH|nr:hypothetical protein [Candidatus Nitrosarchaeum limnium]EPA06054.1 hypothetical protein BG20_I0592 [Candidatus Nitrosarchaeum limnium BG20]
MKKLFFISVIVFSSIFIISSTFTIPNFDFELMQNGITEKIVESDVGSSLNDLSSTLKNFQNSDYLKLDYLNDLVQNIAANSSIYDLIGFSIGMVIYGIFVYHFYRFLSKRDMFSFNLENRLSSKKFSSDGEASSAALRVVAFIAMNFFIFPFVAFLWFLGYSSIMFLLVHQLPTATIFLVSSALIIAVRISAYYREDLSRDLAKLLPFALLGIFLYNPEFYSLDQIVVRLKEIPSFIYQITAFIVVSMSVEIVLSIIYLIKIKFFHKSEKSKKVDDSEHPI